MASIRRSTAVIRWRHAAVRTHSAPSSSQARRMRVTARSRTPAPLSEPPKQRSGRRAYSAARLACSAEAAQAPFEKLAFTGIARQLESAVIGLARGRRVAKAPQHVGAGSVEGRIAAELPVESTEQRKRVRGS